MSLESPLISPTSVDAGAPALLRSGSSQNFSTRNLVSLPGAGSGGLMDTNPGMVLVRVQSFHSELSSRGESVPESLWESDRPRAMRCLLGNLSILGSAALLENTFTLYTVPVADYLGVDTASTGFAFTILIIVYAGIGVVFSKLGERYGLRFLILSCAAFTGAACTILATCTSLWMFYLGYLVGGLSIGSVFAPCTVACIQLMPPHRQGAVAGLASLSYLSVSTLASGPVASIISSSGFRFAYMLQGTTAVCIMLLVFFSYPRDEPQEASLFECGLVSIDESPKKTNGEKVFTGPFIALYFAFMAGATTYFAVEANVQPILQASLPASSSVLVIALPIGLMMNGGCRLLWGSCTNHIPAPRVLAFTSLGAACSIIFWASTLGSPLCGLISSTLSFFFSPAIYATMAIAITRIYGEERAPAMFALLITADTPGAILGAPGLNLLASNFGWSTSLCVLAAAPLLQAALLMTLPTEQATD